MSFEVNMPFDGVTLSDALKIASAEGKQKIELVGSETDLVPQMTSNTTPNPYVISASKEEDSNNAAYKAFDNSNSSMWSSYGAALPAWIKVDFGGATNVRKYTMQARSDTVTTIPKNFIFQGSNNNLDWVTLDTQENISWVVSEKKTFTSSIAGDYRYYRLYITAVVNHTFCQIVEVEFIGGYSTDGPTATLLQVDLGASYTINEADLLIPCNTLLEAGTVQARRKLDNGSWGSFQDLVAISYYERAFASSGTFQCRYLDIDIKLNSDGTQQVRAGRPRIKNFTPAGGGGGGSVWGLIR